MTSFSNLNRIADRAMARMDELGDEAIQAMRSTPEALARQAANGAKIRAANVKREQARLAGKAAAAATNTFAVGQSVRTKLNDRGTAAPIFGTVSAVEGSAVTLDNGRKFVASALIAA